MIKNVLVVDSDQVMLRTLTGLLKSQGGFLNVLAATNTRQAIELLEKTPIDIVITAIRLPKVDGFRIVAKLTKDYPLINGHNHYQRCPSFAASKYQALSYSRTFRSVVRHQHAHKTSIH